MRPPILLKTTLDILFILLIIAVLGSIILIILNSLFSEEPLPILINDHEVKDFNTAAIIAIALLLLSKLIFIYMIYRLKLLARLFFKKKMFSLDQVTGLKVIGKLIVAVGILDILSVLVYKFFAEATTEGTRIKLDFGGFDSFWFILALGLFFIFLSKVFDNARVMKEENELTI